MMFVASLALGACATTSSPDPLKVAPRPGESTVVISVTGNTTQVTAFDAITVRQLPPQGSTVYASHILKQVATGLARDTSIFVGILPAGEYELEEFRNFETHRFLRLGALGSGLIGRFTVRGGSGMDLGRLVVTHLNQRVLVGRSARVQSNLPLLRQFAPEYAALFKGDVSTGWNSARTESDRVEEYALTRPVGADHPVVAPDGTIFAASRLGSVLTRTPAGQWGVLRGPGIESLMCAMPVDSATAKLVAAGEFRTILRLPPGGKELVPVNAGDLPPGNLLYITGSDKGGWYLAHQRGSEINIFKSKTLENGKWESLRTEKTEDGFWLGKSKFWIWPTKDGLAYALSDGGKISSLNFSTGAWRDEAAPEKRNLIDVSVGSDGSLGILTSAGGLGGAFASVYLSPDLGRTWQEITPDFKVKGFPPVRTRSGHILMPRVFEPQLRLSKDEGKTWETWGEFGGRDEIASLSTGDILKISGGRSGTSVGIFDISYSADEGRSWQYEYSSFNRAAYEADPRN